MKIDIVVVYIPRYRRGHEVHFVPPITGIHLAALTPARHSVRVIHQQVEAVDLDSAADLIALSFFSGFAPEAYRLAAEYRKRGKVVVAGGPHVTFAAEEALQFVDSVVIGEAEPVWGTLIEDAEHGRLKPRYVGETPALADLPTPRYDLLPARFFVKRVVQATRGCPFRCSFCTVPVLNPGFRTRPVEDVLRDVRYDRFRWWWQRKVVWFWDDNLTVKREYVTDLLRRMAPLRKWWLTQASMDIADDDELLDLMAASGCIGVFFGIESFSQESLADAGKRQNKVAEYRRRIEKLHDRGICVMAGFISGLDGDTPESIRAMARELDEIGVDVPFLSILTPYRGTPAYEKLHAGGRLREGLGWEFYNGYNVSFAPRRMSPAALLAAHRALWRSAFSLRACVGRICRATLRLRWGALLMCAMMNGFYGWKALTGNEPVSFEETVAKAT
ncbi:MAG: B12-binding domain-containing radical SAM protein [Nitrososphaerales archaeon]